MGSWGYYRKDTEPFYHSFMYSLISLLSGIYPFLAMNSLLVTIIFINLNVNALSVMHSKKGRVNSLRPLFSLKKHKKKY